MKKMVLLHGWNFKNYTKFGCSDAWENRRDFVEALVIEFEIHKINFPGFCGAQEPTNAWQLDDFATFLEDYLVSNNLSPDYILGYSFGAAIAVRWKNKLHKRVKLILVSPAIIRAYEKTSNNYINSFKKYMPKMVLSLFKDIYLRLLRNEYYTHGTRFLKQTYLNIVKIDLSEEINNIPPEDVILIFGSEDTATPSHLLKNKLTNLLLLNRVRVINGGNHDIANSHIPNIVHLIKDFENEN